MSFKDRSLYGWRIASDIDLPVLPRWEGRDRPPDIRIRLSKVAENLQDSVYRNESLQISADRTCRLDVKGVAIYVVPGGC